jgi:hypothetical protein
MKEESTGPPTLYLGGRTREVELENGVLAWAISASQYIQAEVKNVEFQLSKTNLKLPSKVDTPIQLSYRPELDTSDELSPEQSSYYQSLIGILRWIVEIGCIDICLEVSMLSSHLALPRQGHLNQVIHIFGYLKKYHNAELVVEPSDPVMEDTDFSIKDWTTSEFGHIQGI